MVDSNITLNKPSTEEINELLDNFNELNKNVSKVMRVLVGFDDSEAHMLGSLKHFITTPYGGLNSLKDRIEGAVEDNDLEESYKQLSRFEHKIDSFINNKAQGTPSEQELIVKSITDITDEVRKSRADDEVLMGHLDEFDGLLDKTKKFHLEVKNLVARIEPERVEAQANNKDKPLG